MKVPVVLALLIGIFVLACSTVTPAPAELTPNIDATVEAIIAQGRAVNATVEARAKELVAEQLTATPYPTKNPFGNQTGVTLEEPTAGPTPTPSPVSTATAIPTPTIVPTPTPGPYAKADSYRLGEYWSLAIREYKTVIEADPSDRDAYFFRAYSYHQIRNYWPAISDYDKALELSPSAVAYNNRGDVYRDMARYEQAIDDYTEAIKLDPGYAQAYNSRAIAEKNLGKDGNWSASQACSLDSKYCPTPTPAPTPTPTPAPTPKLHGMKLSVNGTALDPNQTVLDILNGQLVFNPAPDASGKYDQGTSITVTAYPSVAGSTVTLGGVSSLSGNTGTILARGTEWSMTASITLPVVVIIPTAVPTATPVPAASPTPGPTPTITPTPQSGSTPPTPVPIATAIPTPTPTPTPDATSYYDKGVEYINAEDWVMAIEEFDKAIDLDPNYAGAYNGRGYAYNQAGQYQNAINDYTMAVQLDSDYATAWLYNERGISYYRLGQYQTAVNDYTMAIQLEPSGLRYFNRAWAYYRLGEYTKMNADDAAACSLDSQYCFE